MNFRKLSRTKRIIKKKYLNSDRMRRRFCANRFSGAVIFQKVTWFKDDEDTGSGGVQCLKECSGRVHWFY